MKLRFENCSRLNSKLKESPDDSNHIFPCPMEPTRLTPISQWSDLFEIARFLDLPLSDLDQILGLPLNRV